MEFNKVFKKIIAYCLCVILKIATIHFQKKKTTYSAILWTNVSILCQFSSPIDVDESRTKTTSANNLVEQGTDKIC